MKKFAFILLLFLFFYSELNARKDSIDFEKIVHENFKIDLSPFNNAFNPSICKYGNEFILTFRYQPEPVSRPWISFVGIMQLDQNFIPTSAPELLHLCRNDDDVFSQTEDARLFTYKGALYILYNDNTKNISTSTYQHREMFLAQIFFENNQFSAGIPMKLIHKDNYSTQMVEKNWTPFVYGDSLLMYYAFGPDQVLSVSWDSEVCTPIYTTNPKAKWDWGGIRGGTPAQMVDGEFLAFFHSSLNMRSKASPDQHRIHYFMGAYTFSPEPPFKMTKISKEPINGENFYTNSNLLKRVIYPGGYVVAGGNIYVAYGKDDHEVWIGVIDKKKLMKSLYPVGRPDMRYKRNY